MLGCKVSTAEDTRKACKNAVSALLNLADTMEYPYLYIIVSCSCL